MLQQMNEEWYDQLEKWISQLQENDREGVIAEMYDLISGYEQS